LSSVRQDIFWGEGGGEREGKYFGSKQFSTIQTDCDKNQVEIQLFSKLFDSK